MAIHSREEIPPIAAEKLKQLSILPQDHIPKNQQGAAKSIAETFIFDRLSRYFKELSGQLNDSAISTRSILGGSLSGPLSELKTKISDWLYQGKAAGKVLTDLRKDLVKFGIPLDIITSERFTEFLKTLVPEPRT